MSKIIDLLYCTSLPLALTQSVNDCTKKENISVSSVTEDLIIRGCSLGSKSLTLFVTIIKSQ